MMTQYQSSAGATPPSSFLVTIPLDETFRFVHGFSTERSVQATGQM
jgi:hypothetical protein